MAFDGFNLIVYDRNCRIRDSAVGANVCRWKTPGRRFSRIFLGFEHMELRLVLHHDEVEEVRRLTD